MLSRTFGCGRVVWNRTLAARHARWRAESKGTSYAETDRALTAMKRDPDLEFLNEVSAVPLQQTLRHQQAAFTAFWAKRARYPRFKSRRSRQSATYTRAAFRLKDGALQLAKMSRPLRYVWSWPDVDPAAVDPTAVTVARRLARCQRGSANHAKRAVKVARAHARVTDARRDFLHKASTRLVRENDVIAVEDLNVAGMVRNRRLARAISCTGWAAFRSMMEYKAQRHGRAVVAVDRWYPSSKTCSACGYLLTDFSLSTRMWQCPSCGARHDRDVNAAKNILAAGLAAGTGNGADACGGDVRRARATWTRPPVKQEPRPAREGFPVL
jgi:putative transposase